MGFAFIAKNEGLPPIKRLCQIMDVSPRGNRAWRPRMAEELRELGLAVGERKVGRLMRQNSIALRNPPKGCVHHMDRGGQYCSHDYQKLLRQRLLQSPPQTLSIGLEKPARLRSKGRLN